MEEEIHTIEEEGVVSGVASLNGQTGDLNVKTINGQEILGTGNIDIEPGVSSVNGQTGDVNITASDLGAASETDLQDLQTTVAGKQDKLSIAQMNAVNSGIDSTKVAQIATNAQGITNEVNARQSADINLQSQIDGLAASSDVTDIVGTKAQLNDYDTSKLKDNDIVKVLQDESQSGETTYYRWSTTTQTFTLIGEEGPYYTKSEADALFNGKVDKVTGYGLSKNNFSDSDVAKLGGIEAGAQVNVQANWNETDTDSDAYIQNKPSIPTVNNATLTITQNGVSAGTFGANASSDVTIPLTDTTYSNFTGTDGTSAGISGLVPAPAVADADKFLKSDGTWSSAGGGGGIVTLTTADLAQYASGVWNNDIGLWKLPPGIYTLDGVTGTIKNQAPYTSNYRAYSGAFVIVTGGIELSPGTGISNWYRETFVFNGNQNSAGIYRPIVADNSGVRYLYYADSAGQNADRGMTQKAITDFVNSAVINGGTTAPTTATVGSVGTLYSCVESGAPHLYSCTAVSGSTYTWSQLI